MKRMGLVHLGLVANVVAGCTHMEVVEDGPVAEVSSAIESSNSLVTNAIDFNGLLANAIDLNGLNPSLMSPAAVTALQDPGQLGANSRLLLKYLIGCAFIPTQSYSFSWTDSSGVVHPEVYWGEVGLAKNWENTSLTLTHRRWVSACLAARANYFGVAVTISMRGGHSAIKQLDPVEEAAYPLEEGAFWGDLFDGTPQLHACYKTTNVEHSRLTQRACATGRLMETSSVDECAYIGIRGDCDTLCDPLDTDDLYRPKCYDLETGAHTNDVVTVFLAP